MSSAPKKLKLSFESVKKQLKQLNTTALIEILENIYKQRTKQDLVLESITAYTAYMKKNPKSSPSSISMQTLLNFMRIIPLIVMGVKKKPQKTSRTMLWESVSAILAVQEADSKQVNNAAEKRWKKPYKNWKIELLKKNHVDYFAWKYITLMTKMWMLKQM